MGALLADSVEFADVLESCINLLDAHDCRAPDHRTLTLSERQEIGVLQARLTDFFEAERRAA